MRAVNLIPADARSGGGAGLGGRSNGLVYFLLGGLAIVVGLLAAATVAGRTADDHRSELAGLQQQIASARARAAQAGGAGGDTKLAETRLAAVRDLARSRIDWSATMDAIARTLPEHTWLSTLNAAASPTSAVSGGTGGAGAVASSSGGPSIQISGCTPSQNTVARLLPRLRLIPGVEQVSLVSSTAADSGASGSGGDCSAVSFQMVVFLAAPAASTSATAATTTTAATTPASTGATG